MRLVSLYSVELELQPLLGTRPSFPSMRTVDGWTPMSWTTSPLSTSLSIRPFIDSYPCFIESYADIYSPFLPSPIPILPLYRYLICFRHYYGYLSTLPPDSVSTTSWSYHHRLDTTVSYLSRELSLSYLVTTYL